MTTCAFWWIICRWSPTATATRPTAGFLSLWKSQPRGELEKRTIVLSKNKLQHAFVFLTSNMTLSVSFGVKVNFKIQFQFDTTFSFFCIGVAVFIVGLLYTYHILYTIFILLYLYIYMSQLLLLGKFEYGGGPIFKVVLEC